MEQKDRWIDEVLNSVDGIGHVPAPSRLHESLMQRFQDLQAKHIFPKRTVWLAAAGLALLISINAYTLLSHAPAQQSSTANSEHPLTKEYFSLLPTI